MPNSQSGIARVVIDSNLPQLDREFEYRVPAELADSIKIGCTVSVPFGKSRHRLSGYVVGLSTKAEFAGELAAIEAVTSKTAVLAPSTYALISSLSRRHACAIADVLKLAVPTVAVSVDKSQSIEPNPSTHASATGRRYSVLTDACYTSDNSASGFVASVARRASAAGGSTLVIVPDDRAAEEFIARLAAEGLEPVRYLASATRVERYRAYAAASRSGGVLVGTRSAAFLPVRELHSVILWDDGDSSYQEPTAPYLQTREVVLLRQQLENFDLYIAANSVSVDVARLCSIGHLQPLDLVTHKPALATSDDVSRLDSLAFRAIKEALAAKRPVLVQVAARGASVSVFCKTCRERVRCRECNGPLWLNERSQKVCRWCAALNLNARCDSCGGIEFASGRAGSTRTISELGRAFPGATLIEATGVHQVRRIEPGAKLVVATPGAEPTVDGGYGAVVLLDAANLLSKDSLRAREEAIRNWANAIALLAPDGRATLSGLVGPTAQDLCLWNMRELAAKELAERQALGFPPAVRLASVIGAEPLLRNLQSNLSGDKLLECLGPFTLAEHKQRVTDESRLLIKYPYAKTLELSSILKSFQIEASTGARTVSARTGRALRPLRVRMDEVEVI